MKEMKEMKIVVVGGTGFLGSHIVEEALKRGHKAHVLSLMYTWDLWWDVEDWADKPRYAIANIAQFQFKGLDTIVNCGWFSHGPKRFKEDFAWNTGIVLDLIDKMQDDQFKHLIHLSSAKTLNPTQSTYAAIKAGCDMAINGARCLGLKAETYAPWNLFGPRQPHPPYNGFLPVLIHRWMRRKTFTVYGGHVDLNWQYVQDVAAEIVDMAEGRTPTKPHIWTVNTKQVIELVRGMGLDGSIETDTSKKAVPPPPKTFNPPDDELTARLEQTVEWYTKWYKMKAAL